MNYITLAVILITILPIVSGILLGLLRGWRRATLRLGLILVALILAFSLCGVISKSVMNIQVTDKKLSAYLADMIKDSFPQADLSNIAVALAQSLTKIVVFLLLFSLFLFLTWAIAYPICKIFVKPYKDSEGNVKRRRLIGAAIGAGQGLIVGFAFCIIISGLCFQVGKIGHAVNTLQGLSDAGVNASAQVVNVQAFADEDKEGEPAQPAIDPELMKILNIFIDYSDSSTGKFYDAFSKPFEWVSSVEMTVTDENGETTTRKITLSGTVSAVKGVADMAEQLIQLQDIDFQGIISADGEPNFDELYDVLGKLDEIKGELPDEAKKTITDTLSGLAEGMDLPVDIDFGSIDLDKVEFVKEGEIIEDLCGYAKEDSITEEQASDIVDDILDSNIVLPALQNVDLPDDVLSDEQKDVVEQVLDAKADEYADDPDMQSKIDKLRDLLGL